MTIAMVFDRRKFVRRPRREDLEWGRGQGQGARDRRGAGLDSEILTESNPGPARERPTPRIRPSVPVEPENFQCPGRRSEEVCRGSRSPSREGRGKGPRRTDSPHPSVGPRRAGKFSKSKSEVGGRRSRVSKPQPGGRGQGPATGESPDAVPRSPGTWRRGPPFGPSRETKNFR